MAIQKNVIWSSFMVTYEDMKKKRLELEEKVNARRNTIRTIVVQLRDAYIESLSLPATSWKRIDGAEMPYVRLCVRNRDNEGFETQEYTEVNPLNMPLTDDYHADFWLSTVIDDTPRGGTEVFVNVDIFEKDGAPKVVLREDGYQPRPPINLIRDGNSYLCDDICKAIKDIVLMSIVDPGLNRPRGFPDF
ncbi:hypothetical protein [Pantoea agglomerans]|uniref:Uncharacterized protein n=1 Tax=Enterobacter agglomerans TaxID=549 RepID=A0ACC5PW40_ENTAG|nr:hypothetical protein [Pantoea agglomerans]MBD8128957.1 hypothetical protein [Pantoea agglomerans]MBD8156372.1 hypothetical protein [Pantoea agglomerans]